MMSIRPLIGISLANQAPNQDRPVYELPATYAQAVEKAGGLPVLLPHTADEACQRSFIEHLAGLLIPGGEDVNPALYRAPCHPRTVLMDSRRQGFDIAMLTLAETRNLPTLGVCLGCQWMNVQRGGSLHQFLPDLSRTPSVRHAADKANTSDRNAWHEVHIHDGTRLADILGVRTLRVNSRHRQGIDRIGRGLVPTAFAPDGLIEAIEDPALPWWIGVQWHGESLGGEHDKLFTAFIAAARAYHGNHS